MNVTLMFWLLGWSSAPEPLPGIIILSDSLAFRPSLTTQLAFSASPSDTAFDSKTVFGVKSGSIQVGDEPLGDAHVN